MRVLHIGKFYSPHKGGIETHLQLLCRELKSSIEIEIDVIVSSDDRRKTSQVLDGVRVRRLPKWFTVASAAIGPGLVKAIRSSPAEIVHLHLPHPVAIIAYLASGHPGRLVITYHSDIIRQKIIGAAFSPFLRAALHRASAIIVTSPNYVDSSPVLRKLRKRCVVIPFGVQIDYFDAIDVGEVARIRAEAGPRVVLAVGRLVDYKGFEYLIRAMGDVQARLILVGDGPLREPLLAEARRRGLDGRILFVHSAEDLRPYYRAADVFVLPSITRAEAFGIVQLEAMACGKPVVNTILDSGVVFVSVNGQTGLSVPPRDSAALAGAINQLLNDPDLRIRFGEAARERVERHFTVELMAQRTRALYERIMSARPSDRCSSEPSAFGGNWFERDHSRRSPILFRPIENGYNSMPGHSVE
jgi:rhamnosyl/mannosyltransferase